MAGERYFPQGTFGHEHALGQQGEKEKIMLKAMVLWAMGVPLVVVVLIWMFFF
ncbi:hypothetical protein [Agrobacterium rosae]|uniref:hypothetical protein n=1 Tax=Agrobacterium rosae TaxID=1972867 RepID=UPI003A813D49